jgi:hypothetical protein
MGFDGLGYLGEFLFLFFVDWFEQLLDFCKDTLVCYFLIFFVSKNWVAVRFFITTRSGKFCVKNGHIKVLFFTDPKHSNKCCQTIFRREFLQSNFVVIKNKLYQFEELSIKFKTVYNSFLKRQNFTRV